MSKIQNILPKLFLIIYFLKQLKGQVSVQTNNANKYNPQNEQSLQVFTLTSLIINIENKQKIIIEGNIKTFIPFEHKLFINPIGRGCEEEPNFYFYPFQQAFGDVKMTYYLNSNEDSLNYRKGINICIEVKNFQNLIKRLELIKIFPIFNENINWEIKDEENSQNQLQNYFDNKKSIIYLNKNYLFKLTKIKGLLKGNVKCKGKFRPKFGKNFCKFFVEPASVEKQKKIKSLQNISFIEFWGKFKRKGNYLILIIPSNKKCNDEREILEKYKINRKIINLTKKEYFSKLIEGEEFKKGFIFCLGIENKLEENKNKEIYSTKQIKYEIIAEILPLLQDIKYYFVLNKEGNFEQKNEDK